MSETWRKSPIFFGSFQDQGCLCQLSFSWDLDLPGLVHGGVDLLGPTVVPEQVKPRGCASWVRSRVASRGRFGVPAPAFQQLWLAKKEKEVKSRKTNHQSSSSSSTTTFSYIILPLPHVVWGLLPGQLFENPPVFSLWKSIRTGLWPRHSRSQGNKPCSGTQVGECDLNSPYPLVVLTYEKLLIYRLSKSVYLLEMVISIAVNLPKGI